MKKLLALAFITMLCIACSVEEETTPNEGTNLDIVLENYKGVFTTADGQTRGTLDVTLAEDNLSASGTLTLSTGEIIMIDTDQITDLGNRKELTFNSNDLSFVMNTGEEGEIMEVNTVTFRGNESAILVGQSTERDPLSPVLGTFACPGCPAPLDNMLTQTFNLMIGDPDMSGNSIITSQTTLGGTIYNGIATQSGCVVNGGQTTCNLNSGVIPGSTGTAFNPGGGPVTWSGTHTFDNGPSGPNNCSTVSGTWTWQASTIGTVGGSFNSTSSGDCPPPLVTLVFEDFETPIGTPPSSGYVVRSETESAATPTTSNANEFNLNRVGTTADVFGRVAPGELNNATNAYNIGNIQGSDYFAVDDTTQSSQPNSNGSNFVQPSLNWFNLDVSSFNTLRASAFFAVNDLTDLEFDADHSVRFEYSTDTNNPASWTTIFAIESEGTSNTANAQIDEDFNGTGDGTNITDTLTEYSSIDVDVSGINTISVRLLIVNLTNGNENIVFDNVTISVF